MNEHWAGRRTWTLGIVTVAAAATLTAGVANAETPPPDQQPLAAATPPPDPAPPPPPPAAVVAATPPPAPVPATPAEAMPASKPDTLPPISVGAWTRVGGKFQGGTDPSQVNDFSMDTAYVELHAGGKIHKKVGVTLNLNGNMTAWDSAGVPAPGALVSVMDAIIQFDFMDEFHLWAGHLLVPVDRANASGPFFMIPWRYPGFFTIPGVAPLVVAPREGPYGRNNGAVVWGDLLDNKLTYLFGVFDNAAITTSPLVSGRLRLALWDKEPGFWGNGSHFGDKDILSIGAGGQFQKDGVIPGTDWTDVNADVLVEKKLGGGSFVTGEGAYYHYGGGAVSDTFYLLAAYATPTVGVGNVQPMVRYQYAKLRGTGDTTAWNLDAAVSYLIKGPGLRLIGTFSHTAMPVMGVEVTGNAIQLGAQAIFF